MVKTFAKDNTAVKGRAILSLWGLISGLELLTMTQSYGSSALNPWQDAWGWEAHRGSRPLSVRVLYSGDLHWSPLNICFSSTLLFTFLFIYLSGLL